MRHSLLQLACAAAIGALALSAQAQYSAPAPAAQPASPSASAPKMTADAKTQADSAFETAQAKCNALSGDAKTTCLNDAKAARDRATGQEGGPSADVPAAAPGAGPAASGSSQGSQGNMTKQKN